jgi:hypothetical protein
MNLNVRPELEKSYALLDTSIINVPSTLSGVVAVFTMNEYDGITQMTYVSPLESS